MTEPRWREAALGRHADRDRSGGSDQGQIESGRIGAGQHQKPYDYRWRQPAHCVNRRGRRANVREPQHCRTAQNAAHEWCELSLWNLWVAARKRCGDGTQAAMSYDLSRERKEYRVTRASIASAFSGPSYMSK